MSNHHHICSKRLKSNRQVDLEDSCMKGQISCDLSVKFNALKLPSNDDVCCTERGTKNQRQITPVICEDLKKCLKRQLRNFSKQELSDYVVQLLLDCPSGSSLSENIQCCICGCIMHSFPEANSPCTDDIPSKNNRRLQNKPSNDQKKFDKVNKEGSKQHKQNRIRGAQKQSYINKIMSAIDTLCDVRSIFGQEILEKNMYEADQMENNVIRNIEKESRLRFAGDALSKDQGVQKCNKRVQTEGSSTLFQPKPDENIGYHPLQGQDGGLDSSSRGLYEQANSYDRFMNKYLDQRTPMPLTRPFANLRTYGNINTC